MAIFFDLDDTLLDDRGAQTAYLPLVYAAWSDRLPQAEGASGFATSFTPRR